MSFSWPSLCTTDHEHDLLNALLGTAIEPENAGDGRFSFGEMSVMPSSRINLIVESNQSQ